MLPLGLLSINMYCIITHLEPTLRVQTQKKKGKKYSMRPSLGHGSTGVLTQKKKYSMRPSHSLWLPSGDSRTDSKKKSTQCVTSPNSYYCRMRSACITDSPIYCMLSFARVSIITCSGWLVAQKPNELNEPDAWGCRRRLGGYMITLSRTQPCVCTPLELSPVETGG